MPTQLAQEGRTLPASWEAAQRMDLDLDDPEDAVFVLAVLDDEEGTGSGGAPRPAARAPSGGGGSGCASGCGCGGCLIPALLVAAATATGFGALPLGCILAGAAIVLALLDRPGRR